MAFAAGGGGGGERAGQVNCRVYCRDIRFNVTRHMTQIFLTVTMTICLHSSPITLYIINIQRASKASDVRSLKNDTRESDVSKCHQLSDYITAYFFENFTSY